MNVSLILPVFNREERLLEVLEEIRARLAGLNPELIVVYDVTRPDLLGAVEAEQRALELRYGVRSVTRLNQRGFGSALRAGFEVSSGDVIIPIMADCSDDIGAVPRMLAKMEAGADIVAGSRYMRGGAIVGDTVKQRFSRLYSATMRAISGLQCQDASNSFKAYRREVWTAIPNEATSFDISAEMTIKAAARGYRVAEIPAVWTNRQAGRSQFRMLSEFPNYARWLVYAARHSPSRSFLAAAAAAVLSILLLAAKLGQLLRRPRREASG